MVWAVWATAQPAVKLTEGKVAERTVRPPVRMIVRLKKTVKKHLIWGAEGTSKGPKELRQNTDSSYLSGEDVSLHLFCAVTANQTAL